MAHLKIDITVFELEKIITEHLKEEYNIKSGPITITWDASHNVSITKPELEANLLQQSPRVYTYIERVVAPPKDPLSGRFQTWMDYGEFEGSQRPLMDEVLEFIRKHE